MNYLLDINALIALGHRAHDHHRTMLEWFRSLPLGNCILHTSSITELGFVRVAVQAGLQIDIEASKAALVKLKQSSKHPFSLLPDSLGIERLPAYAKTPNKLTDAHLLQLATEHGAKLLTLDKGIPGALYLRPLKGATALNFPAPNNAL